MGRGGADAALRAGDPDPGQWPKPHTDPAVLLPRIAGAAYARAEAALA
ncbi:hypothetical protein [Microbispora sp. NPDC049633]